MMGIQQKQGEVWAKAVDLGSRLRNKCAEGIFSAEDFRCDSETDTFKCPSGELLHRHHFMKIRGHWEYRTKRGTCNDCPLKARCTRAKAGRTLKRHEHQEQLDLARSQSHSEEAREDRKRRQWFQDRNFGDAAVMHGFKRARWRGMEKQSIQELLIATIQNLKILARRILWAFFSASECPPLACDKVIRRSIALSKGSAGKNGGEKKALQSGSSH